MGLFILGVLMSRCRGVKKTKPLFQGAFVKMEVGSGLVRLRLFFRVLMNRFRGV